jgi:hypothetical protein
MLLACQPMIRMSCARAAEACCLLQVKVHVEADPERLLRRIEAQEVEAPPKSSPFLAMHGYSADAISSDRRFRVMEALGSKGLLGRPAAQQALQRMHERAAPRRVDMLTTEQRVCGGQPRLA